MKLDAASESFSLIEWIALQRLRARYQRNPEVWSERELAHLHFLRWLIRTGRLPSDGDTLRADENRAGS